MVASISEKTLHLKAVSRNIISEDFFQSPPSEHYSYRLHNLEKKDHTRANILDECTVLPEGLFEKYFPDEAPSGKKINTKVVAVCPIKTRESEQENIEIVFFRCRNLERKSVILNETRSGKRRFYKGCSFKKVLYSRTLWVIKSYDIAFNGKIRPSFQTIADILKVHRNTAIKYLQADREVGALDWDSGKKTYETNSYHLCDAYRELIIPRPKNMTLPGKVHYAISGKIAKAKGWYKQKLLNHISRENVHHKHTVYLSLRSSLDEMRKTSKETGVDPPKLKQKLSCWHLLKAFNLSFKEKAILSSFGEATLRPAIDDLHYFESKGNKVQNKVALLISRCKHHKGKLQDSIEAEQPSTPENSLEWIKGFLTSRKNKLKFVSKESEIDRATTTSKPFVLFLQSLDSVEKSIFRIYQKVQGVWIDKEFPFARPDFKRAILDHFETAFKC